MSRKSWILGIAGVAIVLVGLIFLIVSLTSGNDKEYGLFFEPKINPDNNLIFVTYGSHENNVNNFTNAMDKFLEKYEKPTEEEKEHIVMCHRDRYPEEDEVCKVNLELLGTECSRENGYGYRTGKPCVFLFPKVEDDWEPEFYNGTENFPEEMPEFLRDKISLVANSQLQMKTVWVSCEGANATYQEYIGPTKFYPNSGFPGFYFPPRRDIPGYMEPLVAFQFQRIRAGTLLSVKCRLWAKNIPEDWGYLHFEIQVE